ncbi:hypothetical protein NDN08_008183 [Rhodosorus marinus]|uniref:Crossover junction endonuclease MUS81 n=1 Tax=Rhodosorus marinus TaxID=101924 RepID=A0AAV8UZM5_9RHOD|nr:hypothetical protein NDN08_008183 [Rhodosorus marinus]
MELNAEIAEFLRELTEEAEAKGRANFSRAFAKALKSVKKHESSIVSVEQVRGIKGIGPYISARIEKHFRETTSLSQQSREDIQAPPPQANGRAPKKYSPRIRSAPFGMLVALIEAEDDNGVENACLGRAELIGLAQKYCDEPLIKAKRPGDYYDGWSSMNGTLIKRGLVSASGNPRRYILTTSGREVASRCLVKVQNINHRQVSSFNADDTIPFSSRESARLRAALDEPVDRRPLDCTVSSRPFIPFIEDEDGSCELQLIIDNREIHGGGCSRDDFKRRLSQGDGDEMLVEAQVLECGDAVFAARTCEGGSGSTYILDYLIERKTVPDLEESILDGRYSRQKYFMGKTEVENLILVVEGDIGKAKSIPPDSLRKELARVVAQDGFLVYQTPNLQETMKLYQNMHKWARKRFSKRTFRQLVDKKETIQQWNERMKRIQAPCMEDVFWQMMLQIPGFGRTKIQKVINNKGIRTFSEFLKLYEDCPTPEAGERFLLELIPRSHTGVDLSRKMYYLFTDRMYFDQRFAARKRRRIDSSQTGTIEDSLGGDDSHQTRVSREETAGSQSVDARRSGGQSLRALTDNIRVPNSQQHVTEESFGGSQQIVPSLASPPTNNATFSPRDQCTAPVAQVCIERSSAVQVVRTVRPEEFPPAEAIVSKGIEDYLVESGRRVNESLPGANGNSSGSPGTEDPFFIDLEPRTCLLPRAKRNPLADIDTMPEGRYGAVEQDELIILE